LKKRAGNRVSADETSCAVRGSDQLRKLIANMRHSGEALMNENGGPKNAASKPSSPVSAYAFWPA